MSSDPEWPVKEVFAARSAGNTIHLECSEDGFDPDIIIAGPWRYILAADAASPGRQDDARDAARYRWLRDLKGGAMDIMEEDGKDYITCTMFLTAASDYLRSDIDAAIDAEITPPAGQVTP